MKCHRCFKEIEDAKDGMVFWRDVEHETGARAYEEFEIAHKRCKPRERWEISWELSWFKGEQEFMDWLKGVVPRAFRVGREGEVIIPQSFLRVMVDLAREKVEVKEQIIKE